MTRLSSRRAAADQRGFTLTELLVATAITLAVTGAAFSALRDATRATEAVGVMADVNQTLRIAANTLIRDLSQAGEGDYSLRTGVSIPSGAGTLPIVRPSPDGAEWFFPDTYTILPAVSPASGMGVVINGIATDVITLLFEDRSLEFGGVIPNIPASGASMNFPVSFDMGDGPNALKEGDLIRFGNGAIQEVTRRAGRTLHFRDDAASNLNQRDAPQGSVMEMKAGEPTFPDLQISRVQMITYYIRVSEGGVPQLVRRVNYGDERVIAVGVENLQLSWDLVDGVNNPTNVETFSDDGAEGQIRKANVYMAARSQDTFSGTNQPMRTSLSTQVSLRSLAFVSRYDLQD
jgi:prepilin-type N-terminal cleavage/methylation domain-containing protein